MRLPFLLLVTSVIAAGCAAEEAPDVSSEESAPVSAWAVKFVTIEHCRPESDVCGTDLYLEDQGKVRRKLMSDMQGPLLLLLKSKKIFACESNAIMETKRPVLIGLAGKTVDLPIHPGYLRSCSIVGTGEEVMLNYSLVEAEQPYSVVRVVNSDGGVLVEKRFNSEGEVEFMILDQKHRANVPAPDWPY